MLKRSELSIALVAPIALSIFLGFGCVVQRQLTINSTKDLHAEKPVRELAAAYPGHFDKPFTLLVLTDEAATCGMREARWWRDWEAFMHQRGCGFLLATSREDSLDLVIAAQMDSVDAPTLVVPSSNHYLRELGIPFVPMNLLIDSSAKIRYYWSAPMDTASSRQLMDTIAAVIARSQ